MDGPFALTSQDGGSLCRGPVAIGVAEIAKGRGAKIIAQTEQPDSPLGQLSDAVYKVTLVGDVDPYGMIATGSSLVNAVAGDVLCVLLLLPAAVCEAEIDIAIVEPYGSGDGRESWNAKFTRWYVDNRSHPV